MDDLYTSASSGNQTKNNPKVLLTAIVNEATALASNQKYQGDGVEAALKAETARMKLPNESAKKSTQTEKMCGLKLEKRGVHGNSSHLHHPRELWRW